MQRKQTGNVKTFDEFVELIQRIKTKTLDVKLSKKTTQLYGDFVESRGQLFNLTMEWYSTTGDITRVMDLNEYHVRNIIALFDRIATFKTEREKIAKMEQYYTWEQILQVYLMLLIRFRLDYLGGVV